MDKTFCDWKDCGKEIRKNETGKRISVHFHTAANDYKSLSVDLCDEHVNALIEPLGYRVDRNHFKELK